MWHTSWRLSRKIAEIGDFRVVFACFRPFLGDFAAMASVYDRDDRGQNRYFSGCFRANLAIFTGFMSSNAVFVRGNVAQ
jgi:hypothetical protein